MIGLLLLWAALAGAGTLVLQRHLEQIDARRRRTAGDFTIDRFDGLGEFKVDVFDGPGHTCPNCFRPCRNVLQFESHGDERRWFFCGHCAPSFMRPAS